MPTAETGEELPTQYRLFDPQRLRMLMKRTGDGSAVSIRHLAHATGVSSTCIGALLRGTQLRTAAAVAERISARCGVDLLVLWVPDDRTTAALRGPADGDLIDLADDLVGTAAAR